MILNLHWNKDMKPFTINKITGAFLMVLIIIKCLGIISDIIFDPLTNYNKSGYRIEISNKNINPNSKLENNKSDVNKNILPIDQRLVLASVSKGKKISKKCSACHSFNQNGPNKVGPRLWGVVGRKPGSIENFHYSSAMIKYSENHANWTEKDLDKFLTSPKKYIKGTAMGFIGLKDPQSRADMIAYLKTLLNK